MFFQNNLNSQKPPFKPQNNFDQKPKVHSYADRAAKPESMMALKDFLNQVVQNKDVAQPKKVADVRPDVKLESKPEVVPEVKPEPKLEPKPELKTEPSLEPRVQPQEKPAQAPIAPDPKPADPVIGRPEEKNSIVKEVPEDVLKRILNQD